MSPTLENLSGKGFDSAQHNRKLKSHTEQRGCIFVLGK